MSYYLKVLTWLIVSTTLTVALLSSSVCATSGERLGGTLLRISYVGVVLTPIGHHCEHVVNSLTFSVY